jgi:hypothetical protein
MQALVVTSESFNGHERSILTILAVSCHGIRSTPTHQVRRQKIDAGLSYHLPDLIF